jgi:hypothetical protein
MGGLGDEFIAEIERAAKVRFQRLKSLPELRGTAPVINHPASRLSY